MCGRYVIEGYQELSERFQLRQIPFTLFPMFNAAPSQDLPVITENDEGERTIQLMRWGLVPRWQKPGQSASVAPINARAETLLEKPMFRSLVKRQRCLIPANGFYEWQRLDGRKQPYFIHLQDDALFGFAGLYDEAAGDASFTIITTAANDLVAPIHDRMPVMLSPSDEADWLSPDLDDSHAAQALLQPYPAAEMTADAVSTAVNNVRNNTPDLLDPIEPSEQPPLLEEPKPSG